MTVMMKKEKRMKRRIHIYLLHPKVMGQPHPAKIEREFGIRLLWRSHWTARPQRLLGVRQEGISFPKTDGGDGE